MACRSRALEDLTGIRQRGSTYQVRISGGIDPATGRQLFLSGSADAERRPAVALTGAPVTAAPGETLAAAGHADDARRAFDTASGLLSSDPVDPALPFLFLGDSHLDR